jgi:hypothetical protein
VAGVRESVAAFEKRTGLVYAPPPFLRSLGRALRVRESCPTLFRYPGPEGLHALLRGELRRLAPPEVDWVWLSRTPAATRAQGAGLFGTVALLEPLRLSPCMARERGAFLGANREVSEDLGLVWVPPSRLRARLPWDRIREPDEALGWFGPRHEEERAAVGERLALYLEELSALRRAGAPDPPRPWCGVSPRERRALLDRHGVRPTWTA